MSTPSAPLIGVATSVGWNGRAFDTTATLDYAAAHAFPLVQVYLNPQLIQDASLREQTVRQAADAGLRLLCHAPALLNDGPATAPATTAAARDLLHREEDKWVVYHFDENQSVEATVAWIERLLEQGVIPCVENFHGNAGKDAAQRHYANYLEVFRRLRGRDLPAVIDIPRFFDLKLELTHAEASNLVVEVFRSLTELEVPVILHLLDTSVADVLDRQRWCPLGQGTLGYATLLPRLLRAQPRVRAAILEYDEMHSPLPSRDFLERFFH